MEEKACHGKWDGKNRGNKRVGVFKYLYVWVILCILAGIILGKLAPGVSKYLDGLPIYVDEAPVVSVPIAISFSR